MTTKTRSEAPLSSSLPTKIDGYDFELEAERARSVIRDVPVAGRTLNRASAQVHVAQEPADWNRLRETHRREVLPNTLDPDSPVVELGWPTPGHYTMPSRGAEM